MTHTDFFNHPFSYDCTLNAIKNDKICNMISTWKVFEFRLLRHNHVTSVFHVIISSILAMIIKVEQLDHYLFRF